MCIRDSPWSISTDDIRAPVCLFRNCIQLEVPKCPGMVTLIDTYTHFEVHVNIPDECANILCPKVFPIVRKAIFKGVHKAALNLGYYNSSPSPALLCPCDRGDVHIATTGQVHALNRMKFGKLTPLQLLWLDNTPPGGTDIQRLTESTHLSLLMTKLNDYAWKWRVIGSNLGFREGELNNIQSGTQH